MGSFLEFPDQTASALEESGFPNPICTWPGGILSGSATDLTAVPLHVLPAPTLHPRRPEGQR